MSPPGIETVFYCGWPAAVATHAYLQSWARHFKTNAFLVIALHCFCRSDGTKKNTTHFLILSSVPTTYDVRRSSVFFCTVQQSCIAKYCHSLFIVRFLFICLYRIFYHSNYMILNYRF